MLYILYSQMEYSQMECCTYCTVKWSTVQSNGAVIAIFHGRAVNGVVVGVWPNVI